MAKKNKTKLVVCISLFFVISAALLVSLVFSSKIEAKLGLGKTIGTTLENPKLKVEAIDVGQGAASLTIFPDGKTMLVDAGTNKSEEKLVSYLKKQNITKIDYFILTHSDNDHTGGADAVYNNFEVVCTYRPFVLAECSAYPNCDPLLHYKTDLGEENVTVIDGVDWAKCVSLMYAETYTQNGEQKQSKVFVTNAGDSIICADTIVRFWWPNALAESSEVVHDESHLTNVNPTYGKPTEKCTTLNNYSAVITVTYYEMNMVITGDAASKVEKDLIASFSEADKEIFSRVFVYFAGHHGSNSSNCAEWLALLDAQYVVVQCGDNNSHPGKSFLERVEAQFKSGKGGTLLATDDNGDIVFIFAYDNGLESAVSYSGNANTISASWWEIVVAGIAVAAVVLLLPLVPKRRHR